MRIRRKQFFDVLKPSSKYGNAGDKYCRCVRGVRPIDKVKNKKNIYLVIYSWVRICIWSLFLYIWTLSTFSNSSLFVLCGGKRKVKCAECLCARAMNLETFFACFIEYIFNVGICILYFHENYIYQRYATWIFFLFIFEHLISYINVISKIITQIKWFICRTKVTNNNINHSHAP